MLIDEPYGPISKFLAGLKNEIEVQVRMFKPKSLQEADDNDEDMTVRLLIASEAATPCGRLYAAEPYPPLHHHLLLRLSLTSPPNCSHSSHNRMAKKHPSFRKLIPTISPSLFSSFISQHPHLNPQIALNFLISSAIMRPLSSPMPNPTPPFAFLIKNKSFGNAEKTRRLMVKSCQTNEDAGFVLSVLRQLNRECSFRLSLREMLDDKVSPNIYTFNTMINAFCKLGNVGEAEMYLSMICRLVKPDSHTYTSFILGHCRRKDVDSANHVFVSMPQKGCRRNEVSYNNLMHGLCEVGRVDEAKSLFLQMRDDNCFPNVRTYTILIDALCGLDRRLEALSLFEEKERKVVPSVVTYNALINGYCKKGMVNKVQKAMTLLSKMLEQKLSPNVVTFNILVYGQCKEGDVDSAFRLLTLMEESNVIADQLTYGPLIDTLCKKGSVDKANEIFDSLKEKGIKVNEVMYTALIDGYCNVEKFDFALALFERMLAEGCLPNSYTYNVLIHGLCKVKKLPEALNFLDGCWREGMKPSIVTYSIVIEHMLKDFDFECAYRVLNHMIALGYKPDVCTYTSFLLLIATEELLIDGYGRSGFLSLAFDTFKSMVDAEIEPSHYTYSVIIKHLSHEKLMNGNEGRKGLDLKPTDGFINIADVWKIMEHDTALKLFEKMKDKNMVVHQIQILIMHSSQDFAEKGVLKKRGVWFNYDEVVWKVLIDGLLQRGFVERCSELDKTLVTDLSARGASGYFAMLDLQKLTSVHFMSQDLGQYLTNERPGMLFFNTEAIGVLVAHDLKRGEFVLQVPFCPPQQKFEDFNSRLFNLLTFRLKCAGCKAMGDAYAEVAEKFLAGNNRIILAGEAAHRFPPAGGFGMNTEIQDGHNLAWKLDSVLKGVAPPSILSTYETERRHFVNDVERIDREELIGRLQAMEETMSVFTEDQTQMKSSISALQNQMVELLKGMNILTGAHAAAATTNPVRRPRHLNADGHFVPRKPRGSDFGPRKFGWPGTSKRHYDLRVQHGVMGIYLSGSQPFCNPPPRNSVTGPPLRLTLPALSVVVGPKIDS
ncbi:hypothetical protein BUALT_BualtUnG0025500 [Buddleja alternifolia]|uniref:FAD-binding domain-containing protein n=1 Tax=Buddleja alternifolia TaxID=168488 RepID=A0AAV6W198_9LAMI|nr:hypothetical protein BUALT_BualtUnG0025500 [Buddleja alternifolia]